MIKINVVAIGDIKEKYLLYAIKEYSKRITRFANLNIIEIKENNPASNSEKDIKSALKKDAIEIEKHLSGFIIVLDILGKQIDSIELSKTIEKITQTNSTITFVIGASNGLSDEIKSKANLKLSFSLMTFPHQLMRVILLEQIYRAFTILNNIAYHK